MLALHGGKVEAWSKYLEIGVEKTACPDMAILFPDLEQKSQDRRSG
jgi:hypothetical protein